ncbi:MAG TPA: glycosyltransferase family 4 protein [Burkholderiales bacterium]|nr:glycosyltransferase family 4 protein [Burkholderiales bacterium]
MKPESSSFARLIMLGAEHETRGSIAAVVDAYRTHGLFQRWPIDYLPIHGARGAGHNAALALGAARRFALLLARHRRAIVHMHVSARGNPLRDAAFMAAALAARCPLIVQLHGAGLERSHGNAFLGRLLASAACVLIPCESLRPWVRSVVRGAHTECLPAPVASAPPSSHETRPNLILFLGRLEAAKGIFDLLEAVAAVRATIPDVRLVCAGDGERIAVARYAERLGIADAVKFTGWVGPSGKRALLETAAVFALPSYDEALPVGLCEAMAAGVPPVVSPVGGITEVVADGVSGLLVAPGDKASLERNLRRLLTDRALGARLGIAARETARLRFAPERTLGRLEEIYAALGLQSAPDAMARPADLRQAA